MRKKVPSHKKMYPPSYENQLNLFDHDKNTYLEQQLQQKRRQSPKQSVTKYDLLSYQRFLITRPRSTNMVVDDCFFNQILKKSDGMQIPRQVSPMRYKISEEEPLMKKKRSVSTFFKEDHVKVLLTDIGDESFVPRTGKMMVDLHPKTPKFLQTGLKTNYPAVKSDPITQGIDYRQLNITPEVSPTRKPRYKQQEEHFFQNGFGIFTERIGSKPNTRKYQNQRSSKVRELINQENKTPPPNVTTNRSYRGKDQIGRLMTDTALVIPKSKNNKDFKGDQITRLLTGNTEPPSPKPKREYEYSAWRQNYNIFQEQPTPELKSPQLRKQTIN